MPSSVQSLEVSYFLQMTEDEEKVGRAVAGLVGDLPVRREEAEGHFGNRIVWVRQHVTGEEAEAVARRIFSRMGPEERRAVLRDLPSVVDEHGALYIRLNKQALVVGQGPVLASSDPIRVRVKPRSHVARGDPAGFYARLLQEGGR